MHIGTILDADVLIHAIHDSPKLLLHDGARDHVDGHIEVRRFEVVGHLPECLKVVFCRGLRENGLIKLGYRPFGLKYTLASCYSKFLGVEGPG